jgi:hypothetical protein
LKLYTPVDDDFKIIGGSNKMKIRLDYVTNSSSSSFYVLKMTNKDILEKIKGTGFEEVAVYEKVTDEASGSEKVLEKMLQMIEKQSGEEYCYHQDQHELLADTYIAVLENEKKIKVEKKDILVESHDEYWGEFVENLVEEHGIACHHADIVSVTFDNEGNMQNSFRLEFYEEPGALLQADADALEMLINGEASVEKYLEGLEELIGDTTPVIIAFQKGLREKKGLLDEDIKKIMGVYYDQKS